MLQIHLETIDSTNTYAKKHVHEFPPHDITCITAEEQTAGRGRYQRKWISPPHVNLYATFFFRLQVHTPHLISLAQIMALSFAKVLLSLGFEPKIKWPNDIQLKGKKVSGVLCETQFQEDFVDIFLGVGINVNLDLNGVSQIDQPATSLFLETGKKWDKDALLKKLQKQFESDLALFKKSGFAPFHNAFETLLAFKGQMVRCFDGKKEWEGICHSITADGQLNLYLLDKTLQTISSGEISLS